MDCYIDYMSRRWCNFARSLTALGWLALAASVPAGEITQAQTPRAVLEAVADRLNGSEIERITMVEHGGRRMYRIEAGGSGKTDKFVLEVFEDGSLAPKTKSLVPSVNGGKTKGKPAPASPVPGSSEVRIIPAAASQPPLLALEEANGVTRIKSAELMIQVDHAPWRLTVFDPAGRVLLREAEGGLKYGGQGIGRLKNHVALGHATLIKRDPPCYRAGDEAVITGDAVRFDCETTEPGREASIFVSFQNPGMFSVWLTVPGTVQPTSLVFESSLDEHFFGLGESWNARSLDLKGVAVTMANGGGTPDQGGWVPFYLSTRGYGLLIDNYLAVRFDFAHTERVTIQAPPITGSLDGRGYFNGSSLLWCFYHGPEPLKVIERFTSHVSRPALPPSWAIFAPWVWRDTSYEAEVYQDVRGLREARIPCGLFFIDRPWATGDANMPPPFEWMPERFPNGAKMFKDMNEMGYKTGVWVAKNLYGDFDNPELNAKLKRDAQPWLRRDNAQMYKIDRGNAQRMDPYFTCQAYWETWDEVFHGDFVTLPRVVAFRGNKHVNGKWPGDNLNSFDYPSGLMANVAPMLNLAISGFPFWGADTGGFPDPPGNEVTIRWAQFSALCPIFQTAGAPHLYDEPYRSIFRTYAELYTQLFPYRWSYARQAHETGHPLARALALQYPNDPAGYNQKFEYLFGEWLLVAPMVMGGAEREVFLPKGRWFDWWDGKEYKARKGERTISYHAPLEKLPLLVRGGAIIPMIPIQQTWQNSTMSPMTLRIYPEGQSSFTIRADDLTYPHHPKPYTALEETTIQCRAGNSVVAIEISESSPAWHLEVHLVESVRAVTVDGRSVELRSDRSVLEKVGSGYFHDAAAAVLWVAISDDGKKAHRIEVNR